MRVVITGVGVWTAAGRGMPALRDALRTGRRCFSPSPPYDADGLRQPACGRIADLPRDRPVEALLRAVAADAVADAGLDAPLPGTGLIVGTSSGNISGYWERWHRALLAGEPCDEAGCGRDGPTIALAAELGGPHATVSVACASGTSALALARGWLEDGLATAVLAGGADALSLYIHAGFSGLGALSATVPRPLHPDRDGLLLGDGAALLMVEPYDAAVARGAHILAELRGGGSAADGVHATAPDRQGRGSAAGMRRALADAGVAPELVDMVSLHGTATVFNDAMEARAVRAVFGDRPVAVHAIKSSIGHTLGAAGAIEAAVVVDALRHRAPLPHPVDVDPDCPILAAPVPMPTPTVAVSTSSAFGGANSAIVLCALGALPAPGALRDRPVYLLGEGRVSFPAGPLDWRSAWPDAPARFARLNRYVRVGLLAVRAALEETGPLPECTGVVLSSVAGCRGTDLVYHARVVKEGAGRASRLHFTYTVPSAPAGEASILWKLRGPTLTLLGAEGCAEAVARRWVGRGRAEIVVALHCDAPGPDLPATAVARVLAAMPVACAPETGE